VLGETVTIKETKTKAGETCKEGGSEGGLRRDGTDITRKPQRAPAHAETMPYRRSFQILTSVITHLLPPTSFHHPNYPPSLLDPPPHLRRAKTYTARTQQLQTTPPHDTRAIPGP
jgi:hypothetical protein